MEEYRDKKFEDVKHPFENLDKIQVLQESKIFTENKPNAKKCTTLISKILYVLGQGVSLRKDEATSLFVQCTMLFGIKNKKLRRMLYLILKELSFTAEQTFIACSSLSTDMNRSNQKDFPFKANVIRTLRAISDMQTFMSLERHFVEALVDQEQSVSSSAIISGLFVSLSNVDVVKRWTKQIYSSMKSRFHMSQYHALALMYRLQAKDMLSVSKLILSQSSQFRSPLAHCLLIKYSLRVLLRLNSAEHETSVRLLKFLDTCLTYKNEMIVLSAAKTLIKVPYLDDSWIEKVVKALTGLLTSFDSRTKSVTKFASLRILGSLAEKHPKQVSTCSKDIEKLIKSTNKNLATLAISTLLKCSSSDIDMTGLSGEINTLMRDIPDDYKLNVIESIRSLIPRCPKHHIVILNLLEKIFSKVTAGVDVKISVVRTIIAILNANEKVLSKGVLILCEFIEDCEFDVLLKDIIHHLGVLGPKITRPTLCIRYIFNRIYLESASVRAAAVDSLTQFGTKVESLNASVRNILQRVRNDPSDDVRERVIFSIKLLEKRVHPLPDLDPKINIENLERSLLDYSIDESRHVRSFDVLSVKDFKKNVADIKEEEKVDEPVSGLEDGADLYKEMSENIPQLKSLGKPIISSENVLLTEEEGDYVVKCTKHFYKDNIVLQFDCLNNVEDQRLVKVGIEIDVSEIEGLSSSFGVQASSIGFHEKQPILVCLRKDVPFPVGTCRSNLTFKIFEEDVDEEDYEDSEYELEDFRFNFGNYLLPNPMPDYKEKWGKLSEANESIKRKMLPKGHDLPKTVAAIVKKIGVEPLNEVHNLERKKSQSLYFGTKLTTGEIILIATKAMEDKTGRCKVIIYVRNENKELRDLIINKLF